jgi:hypothetical protein
MRLMPYLIQHPSGIYYAQRKVGTVTLHYPKLNNVMPNSLTERLVNNRRQTAIADSRTTGTLAILSSLFARARRAAPEEAESD